MLCDTPKYRYLIMPPSR